MTDAEKICLPDDPHALLAITVILPPDKPETALIMLVFEFPVHPLGKVQV